MPRVQPTDTRLGEFLRPRLTLGQLAAHAGCSYSFVAKVSAGKRRPNERVKRAVEELCGVPWWTVFPTEGSETPG